MSTEKAKNKLLQKTTDFWLKYEPKIILIFAFILVAALAFEAGILKSQNYSKKPLIIEKIAECSNIPCSSENAQKTQNLTSGSVSNTIGEEVPKNCQFVASKNSDKYHKADCSWAKRIKPENQVCFSAESEAQSKGYKQAGCCFK